MQWALRGESAVYAWLSPYLQIRAKGSVSGRIDVDRKGQRGEAQRVYGNRCHYMQDLSLTGQQKPAQISVQSNFEKTAVRHARVSWPHKISAADIAIPFCARRPSFERRALF